MEQQENVNTNLNLTLKENLNFSLHPLQNYLNIIGKTLSMEYYF
nr:hypothetical protein [Clostridium botulinum]